MDENKISLIKQRLESAEKSVVSAKKMLEELTGVSAISSPYLSAEEKAQDLVVSEDARVIEGVFDGESMIGPDKQIYPVPANYASKSKLVEGDILKLKISENGTFLYKQIGPVDRKGVVGELIKDSGGSFYVKATKKKYRILLASVTYFQADEGDEITLMVPQSGDVEWGAVENVIKKGAVPTEKEKDAQKKEEAIKALEQSNSGTTEDLDQLDEIGGLSDI